MFGLPCEGPGIDREGAEVDVDTGPQQNPNLSSFPSNCGREQVGEHRQFVGLSCDIGNMELLRLKDDDGRGGNRIRCGWEYSIWRERRSSSMQQDN
ncbi:hypothetical protein SLA2020_269180 [Shorea laevis]